MEVKSRILHVKNGEKVERYYPTTNRKLLARVRGCSGESYRVLVKYSDEKNEYDGSEELANDSGWYSNKRELLRTARIFLEEK